MFDTAGVVIATILTILFAVLAIRAIRADAIPLRLAGLLIWGLFSFISGFILIMGLLGFQKANVQYNNPVSNITVAGTPDQIARGQKLATLCTACHAPDDEFPLIGQNFFTVGGPPIGIFYGPNLTPLHINSWTDGELIRAIREGIHKDGRSLIIMPSDVFRYMSDSDVEALVAFLRSQPATEPDTPPTQLNLIGAAFLYLTPLQTAQEPVGSVPAPPEGPNAQYGEYLVNLTSCKGCHGLNLAGLGTAEGGPVSSPNLTQIIPTWTEEEFISFFRTGITPDDYKVSDVMPWQDVNRFANDNDLKAMFIYLHELTPIEGTSE
jgi:cytochrome c553